MPLFMERRFPILLACIVFIIFMYATQAFVLSVEDSLDTSEQEDYYVNTGNASELENLNASGNADNTLGGTKTDILGLIGGLFMFATFQFLEMPTWAFFLLNFMMIVVLTTLTYIVISIMYDFVKALPFT